MPELPEVETVVRLLRKPLVGRTLERVRAPWLRSLGGDSLRAFGHRVVGTRVRALRRRAKFIVIELEREGADAGALVVHLRMTGRLHVEPRSADPGPYARVLVDLDGDRVLTFVDVRKFGRFLHRADPEELFRRLGPEPLDGDLDAEEFAHELRSRRRMLKPLLLDQSFIAGLGNIYVDESLHRVKLHPEQSADRVSAPKARALFDAIQTTLRAAIEREGSSFDAFYRTPEGQPGSYQHQFRVYGRTGRACPVCGTSIRKSTVAQRGTHHCPRCQRRPSSRGKGTRHLAGPEAGAILPR